MAGAVATNPADIHLRPEPGPRVDGMIRAVTRQAYEDGLSLSPARIAKLVRRWWSDAQHDADRAARIVNLDPDELMRWVYRDMTGDTVVNRIDLPRNR